ncbi:Fe-S protein assembly co-chaperone HscB [Burkholderiaceae bacterium DAT-1]|nr:Fe-S protein assembly co-chaperone HscB [Burkholderiaceae bacterium DAT-1]
MEFDFSQNHFELFGLPVDFDIDAGKLEAAWRELQSRFHPDRAASLGDAEKRLALQAATQVNEAWQTLKLPLARGRYILKLRGVDTQEETNTAMPVDFLMQQMEWRETVSDARSTGDVDGLEDLAAAIRKAAKSLEAELGAALNQADNAALAALTVRKLRFMEKLEQEISDAIGALLD